MIKNFLLSIKENMPVEVQSIRIFTIFAETTKNL